MATRGGGHLEVLVAAGTERFAVAVADGLEDARPSVTAEPVGRTDDVVERGEQGGIDGVVVDDGIDAPTEAIDRLTSVPELPVVLLADSGEETVASAVDAGVTDLFPRVSTPTQCALIADRIADAADERARRRGATGTDEATTEEGGAYREVFENVGDGLVLHDPETGEIIDVNERFCEMNGYDRRELIGEDVGLVTAPGEEYSYEAAHEMIERAYEGGPQLFEWRNQHRSGETFPVEVHLAVMEVGGAERVLASVRDVTERKHRERIVRRLHESTGALQTAETTREVCEAAAEAAEDALDLETPACWLREVNEEALVPITATDGREPPSGGPDALEPGDPEYRAYEREEAIVGDIDGSGEGAPREAAFLLPLGDHGVFGAVEPDGETLDGVTLDAARILARHARAALDRVDRERELRRSERRFQLIAEHIDEIIYLATADFSEILYINPAYEGIYGRSVEELEENPRAFVEGAHPEDRERYDTDVERLIADVEAGDPRDVYEGQYRLDRDGETRWVTVSRFPVENDDGTVDRIVGQVRDVTERKRREREYEQIFNGVHDTITIHNPETGETLDVNDTFCDLLGYDHEELLEMGIDGFSAANRGYTMERAREFIREVVESGEPGQTEWQVVTADGEVRRLEVNGSPVEIGGERRFVSISRDVTERYRREREYEQIFNGVQDAILVMDPETLDILDANDAYLDLLGYDDLEAIRKEGVEGLSLTGEGYTVEEGREIHRRVAETGEPELVEWRGETSDGRRLWLEIKVAPAVINGQEVNVAIHRDVTERRLLERRFRTIAERVEEIIYLATADLTEVLYVNEAYTDVFGRPTEELGGDPRAFLEAVHPEDRDAYEADLDAMLAEIRAGEPDDRYGFEYRVQRPDGSVRWVEQTCYPIVRGAGDPNRFVGITKDVTERHRRERTLETFHEATRELTTADSREAACRRAVRAAEEVLGFPLVSTYLYDEETGTLEPAAITTRLEDLDVDLPSFGSGDSLPWQVFVEGESITSSGPEPDVYGPGVSGPDVVLPLGSHGVMLVGSPSDAFETEDVELAQILAATLEAALNHVAGERALAEREEELNRQRERAEQLEQLNAIIRDIERATVEQTSRAGIEEAVCERLTDTELLDLVWIGEPTVGDDKLIPRTSAGGNGSYVDALTVEVGSDIGDHPAVVAYRDGDPRVVENVATDVRTGEWRKTALRHGIQSVVAVPIQYETSLHGVLTAAAGEPNAFNEATRNVLTELGRSIGYAITVAEREQALESEGTTEVEFSIDDDGLFVVRGAAAADCRISLERTIRRSGGSFSMFYLVEDADPGAVVELAGAAPSVESAQVVSSDEDGDGGLIEVLAPTWFGSVFTDHGAVVREATVDGTDGTLVVEAPRGADVRTIVEGFQERYPDTEMVAKRQRERTIRSLFELQDLLREELTDRQWETLETAYSAGYFAWPREVSGEEVADLIGITQPTFNKHLRLAERTAFRMLLDQEYSGRDE